MPISNERLKTVIANLEVNEANFTNSGKPDAKVLTDILNTNVSANQRDEVWAEMQAEKATLGDTPLDHSPEPDPAPLADTPPEPIAPDAVVESAPAVNAGDNSGNLYLNVTNRNVFCMAGRVGGGETVDLGDEDPSGYKGRLEKV